MVPLLAVLFTGFLVATAVLALRPSRLRVWTAVVILLSLATASAIAWAADLDRGGLFVYDGDPGVPIVLVAAGGLLLLVTVLLTASGVSGSDSSREEGDTFTTDEGIGGATETRRNVPAPKGTKRGSRRRRSRR